MLEYKQNNTVCFGASALGFALLGMLSMSIPAAEVRGAVSVQQGMLFGASGSVPKDIPVSVALFPGEGQPLPLRGAARHDVRLQNSEIEPLYLAFPRGDRVRFRNQGGVYHELFAHSQGQPIELRLDRAGLGSEGTLTLSDSADLHWFCRIHAKSYARIDVLDTPLVLMVRADEPFEFRNLAPGKWLLRIAAPGADTRILEVQALTAPPPLQVRLTVKGFSHRAGGVMAPRSVAIEQLFPSQPGL
jgi:hypothetical protein